MSKNQELKQLRREVAMQLYDLRVQHGQTQEETFAKIHCHLLPRKARRVDLGQYDYSMDMLILLANLYEKRVKIVFE